MWMAIYVRDPVSLFPSPLSLSLSHSLHTFSCLFLFFFFAFSSSPSLFCVLCLFHHRLSTPHPRTPRLVRQSDHPIDVRQSPSLHSHVVSSRNDCPSGARVSARRVAGANRCVITWESRWTRSPLMGSPAISLRSPRIGSIRLKSRRWPVCLQLPLSPLSRCTETNRQTYLLL